MEDICLVDTPDTGFAIESPQKSFIVLASSQKEKEDWVKDLSAAIEVLSWPFARPSTRCTSYTNHIAEPQMSCCQNTKQHAARRRSLEPSQHAAVQETDSPTCSICKAVFTLLYRKHHCKVWYVSGHFKLDCPGTNIRVIIICCNIVAIHPTSGEAVCKNCSTHKVFLPNLDSSKPSRVCDRCLPSVWTEVRISWFSGFQFVTTDFGLILTSGGGRA